MNVTPVLEPPRPALHDDYRAFLKAWLAHAAGSPSMRTFAKRAGCSAPLLSRILSGTRDLEGSRVGPFASALQLPDDDARAFAALVQCAHGSTLAARRKAKAELVAIRQFQTARRLDDLTCRLFGDWFHQAIAELAHCSGFRAEPERVAASLLPPITGADAASALETLVELGLLVRDGQALRAAPSDAWATSRTVPKGELARALARHHQWTLRRAQDALVEFGPNERDFSTVVLSLSPAGFQRLRSAINRFQEEVMGLGADTEERDRVYSVAVQVFPLSGPLVPK